MSCFSELHYNIYLDGELSGDELRAVETHLESCPGCRALVEALRSENRFLAAALEETEEVVAPATRLLDLVWTAGAVLAAAAGLQVAASWASGVGALTGMDWLNPMSLSGQMNLLFGTLFYLVREGATMLVSSLTAISILVLSFLVVGAGVFLARRRPAALAVLVTLAVMLGLAQPGAALDKRKADTITIGSGETIDDSVLAKGTTVNVDGTINGDLFVFAQKLYLRGAVKGSVIAFVQSFEMNGTVEGNVYTFVQWFQVGGQVGRNLYAFCQNCKLNQGGSVQYDAIGFGETLALDGRIGRDANLHIESLDMRGNVGRHLSLEAHRITLFAPARVGGNLSARVRDKSDLRIEPGATVVGKTETHLPKPGEAPRSRFTQPKFYGQQALGIGIAFVVGWLLYWLFPALFTARLESAGDAFKTVGIGFLGLVATPVAALVVGIVLLGIGALANVLLIASLIPVLVLVVWLLAVYIAKLFVALFLGQALLRTPAGQPSRFALPLLLGLVLVVIAFHLPYVGKLLHFLVWLLGLGIIITQVYRHYWRRPTRVAA